MKKSLGNHYEVVHVWASQSQSEGYGSNMLFEGPSVYSYGKHFEIARIVKPGVVLFNPARYSASTSKHQMRARSAVSHMKIFTVPSMTAHKENAEYLLKSLSNELYILSRARAGLDWKRNIYQGNCDKALEYADEFKKEIGAKLYKAIIRVWTNRNDPLSSAIKKAFEVRAKADRERTKAAREFKEAEVVKRRVMLQETYIAWKAGKETPYYCNFDDFPVALRVKGNEIQTTRGASVPIIEARKFWHTLKAGQNVIGMRLGHYTVDHITGGNLVVGCHNIPLREVARMAVKLGLEAEAA